ncbi:hypothetical protein WBG78_17110 [Chryseolinea sp. T2]|uniref:hypothetical protein n=1 Tax=Chryseolinea sp. T2 TaxID=3129255 RepID=UPI0030778499
MTANCSIRHGKFMWSIDIHLASSTEVHRTIDKKQPADDIGNVLSSRRSSVAKIKVYLFTPYLFMISPFEYIVILISIVLGMGITQILSGIAGIVQRWNNVALYWPHTLWVLLVFVFHIQEWWITYELRTYEYWRLPVFLFIILYPVNLFILARLLFPLRWSRNATDLKIFYFENSGKLFAFVLSLSVLSIVQNLFIGGSSLSQQIAQMIVATVAAILVVFKLRQPWLHQLVVIVFLIATIIAFALQWDVLLIVNKK